MALLAYNPSIAVMRNQLTSIRSVCFLKQFSYVLTRPHGLHIRPMDALTKEASRFSSRISLSSGMNTAELKKGRMLSAMNIPCGSQVTVTVEGSDEEAAIAAMQNYFVANM